MSQLLAPLPFQATHTITLTSNAWNNNGSFGGKSQRISKPGDKWTLQANGPALNYPQAQAYLSALLTGLSTDVVRYPVPLGYAVGNPGALVVNGNGQAGTNLNLRGGTAGYEFEVGAYFTLFSQGRRTLHVVTEGLAVAGDGTTTVAFLPMMRTTPADGDTVDFATPHIEGFLSSTSQNWSIDQLLSIGFNFTIQET